MSGQRRSVKPEIYINGRLTPSAHCISCSFGAGRQGLPQAVIEVQPRGRQAGRRGFFNIAMARFRQATVEVRINGQTVHIGKAFAQAGGISSQADTSQIISRMDEHLFGLPLYYSYYYDRASNRINPYSLPTVFNPEFDGGVWYNRSSRRDRSGAGTFLHPQAAETATSRRWNRSTAQEWTLPEAVYYLCWSLNPRQTYVRNPTAANLAAVLNGSTGVLRNYEAPIGAFLPEQLDRLLDPFGYGWTVDMHGGRNNAIRVFRKGAGRGLVLRHQGPGATLNTAATNLESCSVTADVSNRAFNEVAVVGDYEQYEVTVELVRAWAKKYDEWDYPSLSKNDESWAGNKDLERVWRDWVLNEAGDYNGVRPEIKKPHDFGGVFGFNRYIQRRRKFKPCLTQNEDGSPKGNAGGVYVEWWDKYSNSWKPIDELGVEGRQVKILERECGIRFDGVEIPLELYEQREYAKVRVTATVESDKRLEVRQTAFPASLLTDLKAEVFDVGTKYKYRKRHESSRFADSYPKVDEVDDTPEAQRFANQLLASWNAATIDGTATLTGIAYSTAGVIGQTIAGVDGRGVSFNAAPVGNRFPTIVGCKISVQDQATTYTLDTFRGETI